jgi:hypothetical protein
LYEPCRLSIFGWYLLPGKLYELYDGKNGSTADGDDNAPRIEEMENRETPKKKERKNKKRIAAARDNNEDTRKSKEGNISLSQCKLGQRILARYEKTQKRKRKNEKKNI